MATKPKKYAGVTDSVITHAQVAIPASAEQVGGSHYKEMGIQVWDVVDTWPLEQRIGYYRGNALKYIMRMGAKDVSQQEVKKAAHYCKKLAEVLEQA